MQRAVMAVATAGGGHAGILAEGGRLGVQARYRRTRAAENSAALAYPCSCLDCVFVVTKPGPVRAERARRK